MFLKPHGQESRIRITHKRDNYTCVNVTPGQNLDNDGHMADQDHYIDQAIVKIFSRLYFVCLACLRS